MRSLWMVHLLIAAGLVLAGLALAPAAEAGVSFGFFYSNLSPHGNWYVSANYGRVWQPAVYRAGWNPYYDGHWAYTDAGYCWLSDYPWGDIPYHYGTWVRDPHYGWVWVPGSVWAPSWVVWRTGPGYVGWAPVAPTFSVGVSFRVGDWDDNNFVFLGASNIFCAHVGSYAVPYYRNRVIINNTRIVNNNITVVNNVVVNQGPGRGYAERAVHRRIDPVPVESVRLARGNESRHLTRDDIRVDRAEHARGLKAAAPVSASTPIPAPAETPKQRHAAAAAPAAAPRKSPEGGMFAPLRRTGNGPAAPRHEAQGTRQDHSQSGGPAARRQAHPRVSQSRTEAGTRNHEARIAAAGTNARPPARPPKSQRQGARTPDRGATAGKRGHERPSGTD